MNVTHGETFDCYGTDPLIDIIAEALGDDCGINIDQNCLIGEMAELLAEIMLLSWRRGRRTRCDPRRRAAIRGDPPTRRSGMAHQGSTAITGTFTIRNETSTE
jgi:hypothetical protein